jgi:hypothetical protein
MEKVLGALKAVVGAVLAFAAVAAMVWADKSISLDEMNQLWLALIPVLVALGVYGTRNKPPTE